MRYDDAELIPTYAYDISKGNALYLRETTAKARSSIKIDYSEAYEFPTLKGKPKSYQVLTSGSHSQLWLSFKERF